MDKIQTAKRNMGNGIKDFVIQRETEIGIIPKAGVCANGFLPLMETVNAFASKQKDSRYLINEEKDELKYKASIIADSINDCTYLIGVENDDKSLQTISDFTASDFFRMRDTDACDMFALTADKAEANAEALVEYGVSTDDITELRNLNARILQIKSEKLDKKESMSAYTYEVDVAVNNMMDYLNNKLDKVMKIFRLKNPILYREYLSARVIVDLPSKKKEEKISE